MNRKRILLLALAFSGGQILAQERYNSADYQEVTGAMVCQCGGCNARVSECAMDRCPSSEPIREEVAGRLQAGESVESILAAFTERYGLRILAAPPASGFHLSVWILPFVALGLGGLLAVRVLGRWKQTSAAVAGNAPEPPSPEMRARIERDLDQIRNA